MRNTPAFRQLLWLALALASGSALGQAGCALPDGEPPTQVRTVYLMDRHITTPTLLGAVSRAVDAQTADGRIELATYDQGLRSVEDYRWPEQRGNALRDLRTVAKASGGRWLNRSLETLLSGLRQRPDSVTTIYVLTGGPDNDPRSGTGGLARALSAFSGARGPHDRLYYVAPGAALTPTVRAALTRSGFSVPVSLPDSLALNLTRDLPPALLELGEGRTPLGQVDAPPALDARAFAAAGAHLSVAVSGNEATAQLTGAAQLPAGTAALLCATGSTATPRLLVYRPGLHASAAAPTAVASARQAGATSNVSGSGTNSDVTLMNPGASGALRRGQSVTWRFQVRGEPTTIQSLRVPDGARWTLTGASLGRPIPAGGEFAVSIVNDRLQGQPQSPELQFTSGRTQRLPPVSTETDARSTAWPWLLALLVLAAVGVLAWTRRRPAPTPTATDDWLTHPRALSVENGQVVLHGDTGQRRAGALGTLLDVGSLGAASLEGLKLEADGPGARLVGLPPGLRVTERGRTLAVGDTLRPDLMYLLASGMSAAAVVPGPEIGAPVRSVFVAPTPPPATETPALPAEPPAPPAGPAAPDFGRLSQDIASLGMLGGVGGLGLPRELQLTDEGLVLRGDAGEQPQELPEGVTDLGEAYGVPALQGFSVDREDHRVSLRGLPAGFHLHASGAALDVGSVLPLVPLTIDVPAWLQATVERVRAVMGEEVDTRDAGIDFSGIGSAIDLDHLFGDAGGEGSDLDPQGPKDRH